MRIARTLAKRFKIEIPCIARPVPPMPVHMVWHESLDDDEAHRWLREIMRERLQGVIDPGLLTKNPASRCAAAGFR